MLHIKGGINLGNLLQNPLFTLDENFRLDDFGSLIQGTHLDVSKAYSKIPDLLQDVIDNDNEKSWEEVKISIDYIYECIFLMLKDLDEKTHFMNRIHQDIAKKKLLLFKPDILSADCINVTNHNKGDGYYLSTQWPVVAAIMRWFHDYGNIHYCHMALVEGCVDRYSLRYTNTFGFKVTNEAVIEGRYRNIYGGWGFYFVRRYLSANRTLDLDDNPMNGYEESCAGTYLPPGKATNKMMFYDINQIQLEPSRGRLIPVPDGKNFKAIILHKVIVGGNPQNPEDLKLYPGSILINIPVMKIHDQDLLTNAIKNISMGLYPSKCAESQNPSDKTWLYSSPNYELPNTKAKLPHSPWILKVDEHTGIPIRDESGKYTTRKTFGISGTQFDIIKALQNQNIFMVHISDNINITNISHNHGHIAEALPEGFIWASLDCVSLDLFCSRYCFNTIPLSLSKHLQKKNNLPTDFIRNIPLAKIKYGQIVSFNTLDSPLLRYSLFNDAENRGIGSCKYHIGGLDWSTGSFLGSCQGHLVSYSNNKVNELVTKNLYYNPLTILYNLQPTILSYAKSCDQLFHSNLYKELMELFDENNDGIIDYNEKGRGYETAQLEIIANALNIETIEENGVLKGSFYQNSTFLKYSNPLWNKEGHDYMKERILIAKYAYAFQLSKSPNESTDLSFPNLVYGKGRWPSFTTAEYLFYLTYIYGGNSFDSMAEGSLYDLIFQHYDSSKNSGFYTENKSHRQALTDYFDALKEGSQPLNFFFFVPVGLGKLQGTPVPNTIETNDPNLILTVHFKEIW